VGLLLVLFLGLAVLGRRGRSNVVAYNSRFGGSNSRLGRCEFPSRPLRELPRKRLIWLTVVGGRGAKSQRFSLSLEKSGIVPRPGPYLTTYFTESTAP
jgi:hypothetical protein